MLQRHRPMVGVSVEELLHYGCLKVSRARQLRCWQATHTNQMSAFVFEDIRRESLLSHSTFNRPAPCPTAS
jgi:hypothetical protein